MCCWYSLEAPHWGASNVYHNICFQKQIRNMSRLLLEKKLHYLELWSLYSMYYQAVRWVLCNDQWYNIGKITFVLMRIYGIYDWLSNTPLKII